MSVHTAAAQLILSVAWYPFGRKLQENVESLQLANIRVGHIHQSEPLEWVMLQEIAETLTRVAHFKGSDW